MKSLPVDLTPYKRTREFTELSVPQGLLESHFIKAGTWGKIVVLEGSMIYRILEPDLEEIEIHTERPGIIEPVVRHEVQVRAPVRFYVQFYRQSVA